jgi:hypothetical protein
MPFSIPCTFTLDDSPLFTGFTDGTKWKGFDNVAVTPAVWSQIALFFEKISDEEYAGLLALPIGNDGLVRLANRYPTRIVPAPPLR